MIDPENPEWTASKFKRSPRFEEMPADFQALVKQGATEKVSLPLPLESVKPL